MASYALLLLAAILSAWRFVKGPDVLDRVIAYDSLAVISLGVLILFTRHMNLYKEAILIFTLVGFLGSLSFALYADSLQDTKPHE